MCPRGHILPQFVPRAQPMGLPCTSNSLRGRIYLLGSAPYCIIGVLFRYYFRLFPKFRSWSSADSTFGFVSSTFDFFNGRETWSLVNWGTFPWGLVNGEHWLCFGTGPDQTHYCVMEGWLTLLGISHSSGRVAHPKHVTWWNDPVLHKLMPTQNWWIMARGMVRITADLENVNYENHACICQCTSW